MLYGHGGSALEAVIFFEELFYDFNAGSMGTEVNSALTSKDIMTSSEASWMLFRSCRKSWVVMYVMP